MYRKDHAYFQCEEQLVHHYASNAFYQKPPRPMTKVGVLLITMRDGMHHGESWGHQVRVTS